MGRDRRKVLKGKENVRNMIKENGMEYIMLNNGIFDDLFEMDKLDGVIQVKTNPETKEKERITGETKFSELEMIVFIFLQFMMKNSFTLSKEEIADYVGCSTKQLRLILERLRYFRAKCNSRYYAREDKIVPNEFNEGTTRLVSEKTYVAYNPKSKKNQKRLHWFTDYMPSHKFEEIEGKTVATPLDFFLVTIKDFDLLTNGTLTRTEFITYLFLLRRYKSGAPDEKQMHWKFSTIAEKLNYKLPGTVQNHIEKLLSVEINGTPLIKEIRPKNYELQIEKGEEPSARFIPVYNPQILGEMDSEKEEVSSNEKEVNSRIWEDDFVEVEVGFPKEEVNISKEEVGYQKVETYLKSLEIDY